MSQKDVAGAPSGARDPAPDADALYRLLFTLAPAGVVLVGAEGQFLEFNDRAHEQLGYTREEFARLSLTDVDAEESPDEVRERMASIDQAGAGEFEVCHRTKSGEIRNVLVRTRPLASGSEKRFIATWQDITERKRAEEALRRSTRLLRAFSNSIPDPIFLKDREGRWLFANPACLTVIGKTFPEVLGRTDREIHGDGVVAVDIARTDRRIIESGVAEVVEEHIPTPGGVRVFLSTKVPYRDDDGQVIGIIGSARDITGRKAAELALEQRERQLRTILETALDGYYVVDTQGRLTDVNDAYCAMSGYRHDELLRMRVSDLEAAESERDVAEHIERIVRDGSDRFESRHRRKDGTSLDVEASVRFIEADGGRFVCFVRDITRRKQVEHALRDREERLRQTLKYAAAATWEWDVATRSIIWSPENFELFGIDVQTPVLTYDAWEHLAVPEDQRIANAAFRDAVEGRTPEYHAEFRILHPTLGQRWLLGVGRAEHGPDGSLRRMLGLNIDITERKRAEELARQSQKMESVGRLAGGIAHDFNNLLTVILSCAEEMRRQLAEGGNVQPEDVEDVRTAGARARDLTRQLLAFSRQQVIEPVVLDLNSVVELSEKLLRRVLGEDVELVVRREPGLWSVRCDPGQVDQVIMNLAVNARDAMPDGGTLTLETRNAGPRPDDPEHAGEFATLVVRDSGHGMTAEVKAHLFEPFFTTKARGRGTGLGLATVYGIVKQSHGHLHVESRVGHGTELQICFPRVLDAPVPVSARVEAVATGGTEAVLVAEDDPLVRQVTVRTLRAGGYRVVVAEGGREALDLPAEQVRQVSLLITDVVMPGIDGRTVADELRLRHPGLKVLFVSGYPQDAIARHGVLESGVEFLPKPFEPVTLLARVRRVLDGR